MNWWHDPSKRNRFLQIALVALILLSAAWLIDNAATNLHKQGIASGFGFLQEPAGFGIIQTLIDFSETSQNMKVFWVGLLNTLAVSIAGILVATLLGFFIGIAKLSPNFLLAKLANAYVEIVRNLPLLLQIFVWYFVVLRALPGPREAEPSWGGWILSNRGLYLPWFENGAISYPALKGFNIQGGISLIPEFMAMLAALSTYTAAFIAEIVRAGILAVHKGQLEAASSLGLKRRQTLRLIIVPQAMRVIIPPLTSQYLNLTKNSSLGTAIAYPELVAVFAGTTLNQTGQAVEVLLMTMLFYLAVSLSIAVFMNAYNKRLALEKGR